MIYFFILFLTVMIYFLVKKSQEMETEDPPTLFPKPKPRPVPVAREPRPEDFLESSICEVCSSAPQVQFYLPSTGGILEFCGHHSRKSEKALLDKGYRVRYDAR